MPMHFTYRYMIWATSQHLLRAVYSAGSQCIVLMSWKFECSNYFSCIQWPYLHTEHYIRWNGSHLVLMEIRFGIWMISTIGVHALSLNWGVLIWLSLPNLPNHQIKNQFPAICYTSLHHMKISCYTVSYFMGRDILTDIHTNNNVQ